MLSQIIIDELKKIDQSAVIYQYNTKYYIYLNGSLYRLFTFGPKGYQLIKV